MLVLKLFLDTKVDYTGVPSQTAAPRQLWWVPGAVPALSYLATYLGTFMSLQNCNMNIRSKSVDFYFPPHGSKIGSVCMDN